MITRQAILRAPSLDALFKVLAEDSLAVKCISRYRADAEHIHSCEIWFPGNLEMGTALGHSNGTLFQAVLEAAALWHKMATQWVDREVHRA